MATAGWTHYQKAQPSALLQQVAECLNPGRVVGDSEVTCARCQFWCQLVLKLRALSGYGFCDYAKNLDMAAVQVRLGDINAAFESLERGFTKHEAELIYLKVDASWDNLRADPRFQDLIRRVGLTN